MSQTSVRITLALALDFQLPALHHEPQGPSTEWSLSALPLRPDRLWYMSGQVTPANGPKTLTTWKRSGCDSH